MASPTGWRWLVPVQIVLISAGVISIAMALKVSVFPLMSELSSSYLPLLWTTMLGWLKPPILYLIINGIIIMIAASSRFQCQSSPEVYHRATPDPPERVVEVREVVLVPPGGYVRDVYEDKRVVAEETAGDGDCSAIEGGGNAGYDEAEEFIDMRPSVVEMDSMEVHQPVNRYPTKKPSLSSRYIHRKSLSGILGGGRAPRRRDTERYETLEATWKAINEGKPRTPATANRRLSRCDSWDQRDHRQIGLLELDPPPPPPRSAVMKKSETFRDRNDYSQLPPPPLVKLRKEPSADVDELNRRVEAFIEKFNEEMRLQRQESLEQLKETMGRGL